MHSALEKACRVFKLKAVNLDEAYNFSNLSLKQAQEKLLELAPINKNDHLDVLVFGSMARREASPSSDFDYVVVLHGISDNVACTREILDHVENVRGMLCLEEPGRTQMFGTVISASDLVERIGLEQDTNRNHTRRILLLMESASIYSNELYESLLKAVLKRYLHDYSEPKKGVPRFLLNDVMRYWRTLSVDYQAKRWESRTPDWGLRYIKLLVSRKLAYAGTIASILLVKEASVDYFIEQFKMPALARLAQLEQRLEEEYKPCLKEVLCVADEFVGKLKDKSFRDEARKVQQPNDITDDSPLGIMRDHAKKLQTNLEKIFFKSDVLRERSIKYLSF